MYIELDPSNLRASIESKIGELRMQRRELQLKFKNTLDFFQRSLEAEMDDEQNTATVHTLPRRKKEAAKEA